MSTLVQRTAPSVRSGPHDLARTRPDVIGTAVLAVLALLLGVRWWQHADGVPLSWGPPPAEALFLLPAAPVLALLGLRSATRGGGAPPGHVARAAARWAAVWAAVGTAWLLTTVTRLYGTGLAGLLQVDNLVAVLSASDVVLPRLAAVWVALLVALFARSLDRAQSLAALALVGAALLAVAPAGGSGHAHAEQAHPLVQAAAGAELLALALWSGSIVAAFHLRTPILRTRGHLERWGLLVSGAALALGAALVLAGLARPEQPAPAAFAAGRLAAVAAVVGVGLRHRRRTLEAVSAGPAGLMGALVGAELTVLAAAVALTLVLELA
ncbi:hypothetical protein [Microlunatus flavus]|uniref:Copper resistance protein D n=1 Tax=Microlunatus flavus TaxID=1036181 RepID=A0A1H9J867_9ACTN|nr:hypothetical protein [Microlunatus flavus]SEQ82983.1 hypothetical protein SAMN05421756_106118 [Microlunatus flavus]